MNKIFPGLVLLGAMLSTSLNAVECPDCNCDNCVCDIRQGVSLVASLLSELESEIQLLREAIEQAMAQNREPDQIMQAVQTLRDALGQIIETYQLLDDCEEYH